MGRPPGYAERRVTRTEEIPWRRSWHACWRHEDLAPASGSILCEACLARLPHQIRGLASLYAELLQPASSAPDDEHVSGSRERPIPYSEKRSNARSEIMHSLASWAGYVAEARAVTPPPRNADRLAEFLARHCVWLASAEVDLPEAIEEITALERHRGLLAHSPPRRVERSVRCPACGETAVAYLRRPESLRAAEITCTANPEDHTWDSGSWLEIAFLGDSARLDTEQAAVLLRVDADTIRYYASARAGRLRLVRGTDGKFDVWQLRNLYEKLWQEN